MNVSWVCTSSRCADELCLCLKNRRRRNLQQSIQAAAQPRNAGQGSADPGRRAPVAAAARGPQPTSAAAIAEAPEMSQEKQVNSVWNTLTQKCACICTFERLAKANSGAVMQAGIYLWGAVSHPLAAC